MGGMNFMKYGLQLYSVRDSAQHDYDKTLCSVAEMGYSYVEPAGFFDNRAEDVAAMLKHYGLTACSTHTVIDALKQDFAGTVAYHHAIGCSDLIIPGVPLKTKDDVYSFVNWANENQPLLAKEGIRLHFHNHWKEFLPNLDGIIMQDVLAKETDLLFEIDTFWAHNAGKDPIEILEQYKNRIHFIHLKDGFAQDFSNPESKAVGKSLGSGTAPVAAVRKKAIELGFTMVVESEGLEPTGLEEVKRCIDHLQYLDSEDAR